MRALIYCLIGLNVITFLVYGIDKWKARRDRWRIPEATLLAQIVLVYFLIRLGRQ